MKYLTLLALGILAGCGGDSGGGGAGGGGSGGGGGGGSSSGGSSSSSLSGLVSLGPVNAGTVKVYKMNSNGSRGNLLTTTTTDINGAYTATVGESGPYEVVVDAGCYDEEADGANVCIGGGDEITSVVKSNGTKANVTPLTHIAASKLRTTASNPGQCNDFDQCVDDALSAAATQAGLTSIDINDVLPAHPGKSLSSQGYTESSPEAKYALFLAALSKWAKNNGDKTSVQAADTFAEDFSDGVFDGKKDGNAVQLDGTNIVSDSWGLGVAEAKVDFVNSGNNNSGFSYTPPAMTSVSISTTVNPQNVISGDFNNDGNTDFVVRSNTAVDSYLNDGEGNFTKHSFVTAEVRYLSKGIASGDWNGDGFLDLVVTLGNNPSLMRILMNRGNGTFLETDGYTLTKTVLQQVEEIAVGDFDGDGDLDIAVATDGGSQGDYIDLFIGRGDGVFDFSEAKLIATGTEAIAAIDLDSDGIDEIVCLHAPGNANATIRVMENDGGLVEIFNAEINLGTYSGGSSMKVADGDGDGSEDVVYGTKGFGDNKSIGVLFSNGTALVDEASYKNIDHTVDIEVTDVDGDGKLDIIAVSSGQVISKITGDEDGVFKSSQFSSIDYNCTTGLATGDWDGDGIQDAVIVNAGSCSDSNASVTLLYQRVK